MAPSRLACLHPPEARQADTRRRRFSRHRTAQSRAALGSYVASAVETAVSSGQMTLGATRDSLEAAKGLPFAPIVQAIVERASALPSLADQGARAGIQAGEALWRESPRLLPGTSGEWTGVGFAGAASLTSLEAARRRGMELKVTEGGIPLRYDQEAFARHFRRKPLRVAARAAEIASGSAGFAVALAIDRRLGKEEEREDLRAQQSVELLTRLGPAFVKVGQALSIRVDLLSEPYIRAFRSLQDNVPPFPTSDALAIIEEELGQSVDSIFSDISLEPIASASLGQVYKGTLRDGRCVAVKVQRPGILEGIALDLFLIRTIAPLVGRAYKLNTQLTAIVDEWGNRFIAELDYRKEAQNGKIFSVTMEQRGLQSVMAAPVVDEFTTSRVLTTEWIEGERLEESDDQDVARLCGIALNAYLTMLLDTGVLHADPHPGNLLRTKSGKLCLLDFGLVTEVSKEKQYALIDYIANLVGENYEGIPQDLRELGFVPPGKEDQVEEAGVVNVLSNVLRQLSGGGGAAKLDVEGLTSQLSGLVSTYGNIFQIPPYFLYLLRTFSILEGIGLDADPDYAIVQECYPYLAKRLFTDDSERTRAALRRMLYTPDGTLNLRRLARLQSAFQEFNTTVADPSLSLPTPSSSSTSSIDDELVSLLLSPQGSYVQEILIEEIARITDAAFASSVRAALSQFFLPQPVRPIQHALERDKEEDDAALQTLSTAQQLLSASLESNQDPLAPIRSFLPLASEHAPGLAAATGRLSVTLLRRAIERSARVYDGMYSVGDVDDAP